MIAIQDHHCKIVIEILTMHLPHTEVRVFGSRVNGTEKTHSDLDLVIMGAEKIPLSKMAELQSDFEESDLPFRVDIVDWNRIEDNFKKIIEKEFLILTPSQS